MPTHSRFPCGKNKRKSNLLPLHQPISLSAGSVGEKERKEKNGEREEISQLHLICFSLTWISIDDTTGGSEFMEFFGGIGTVFLLFEQLGNVHLANAYFRCFGSKINRAVENSKNTHGSKYYFSVLFGLEECNTSFE